MSHEESPSALTRLPDHQITKSPFTRWLDTATLSADRQTTTAIRLITSTHPFIENNQLLPTALIELMAQCAAAGNLLNAQSASRKIRRGLLVQLHDFQILGPVPINSTLTLTAMHEKTFGPLTRSHIQAHIAHQHIAEARMTFHLEFE